MLYYPQIKPTLKGLMMTEQFTLGEMHFEYDPDKNEANIKKHGLSFKSAARVFFDYDRIEEPDYDNELHELRYDTIGDTSSGNIAIGRIGMSVDEPDAILFVVYTERTEKDESGHVYDVTRLISARKATSFERGLYYGKY